MIDLLAPSSKDLVQDALKEVHKHIFSNRAEISKSTYCSCFRCGSSFIHPLDIKRWEVAAWNSKPLLRGPQPKDTAQCPHCAQFTVIGDACGYDLTSTLLNELSKFHSKAIYDLSFGLSLSRPVKV